MSSASSSLPRPENPKVRGVLFLNKPRRERWDEFVGIAHEQGRSDAEALELMTKATGLAIEQCLILSGGTLQESPAPQPPPHPLEEFLTEFPGSTLAPTAERGMCSSPDLHAAHHWPHPRTGRTTCWRCYPPAGGAR
jgi:hypothetical protein